MRNLFLGLISFTVLFISSFTLALEGEEQLYAELLTKKNSVHIKAAAQSIYNKKIKNVVLTDLVAEVLLQSVDGNLSLTEDTQAWLAKAIGGSQNLRYKAVLTSIKNSDLSSKIKKYAKKAESKLINESSEYYEKGSLNIEKLAHEIAEEKKIYLPIVTKDKFITIGKGDTLNTVFNKVGLPDDVNVIYETRRQVWVGRISYSMLKIEYKDIGSLSFEYFSEPVDDWTVSKIGMFNSFSGQLNGHPMLDSDPNVVRTHIRRIIKEGSATELELDIAAERLYRDVKDEAFTDTLSWACKLLTTSGNSRYTSVLKNTIDQSPTRKLRKYAEGAMDKLGEGDDKQYLVGDVFAQTKEEEGS